LKGIIPLKTPQPLTSALLAIGLLVLSGVACSYLRPKRPLTWHLTLQVEGPVAGRADVTRHTIAVLERRLNAAGFSNLEIKPDGDPWDRRIVLNLPTTPDRDRLVRLITDEGKLELTAVLSPPNPAPAQTYDSKEAAIASLSSDGTIPSNRRVLPYTERTEAVDNTQTPIKKNWVIVEAAAIVDGSELRDASARRSGAGNDSYDIDFSLTKTDADKFGGWTGSHINQYLGIVLNDEVKSIAFIKSQIWDQGQINGRFSKQSAEDLALVLKSGALPARVTIVEEKLDKAK
jgi:preprotein translocase subunit SecD